MCVPLGAAYSASGLQRGAVLAHQVIAPLSGLPISGDYPTLHLHLFGASSW